MTPAQTLDEGLRALPLALSPEARERLLTYLALIAKWNRTHNLTAIREPLVMVTHHLLDSLAVVPHLFAEPRPQTLADIGSGAGLPGIPIAIACPDCHVTLNDSSAKRVAFLRQAVIELGLENASIHAGRVEDWRPEKPFAVVVSRAFSALKDFVASCRHLVAPGGVLAAMKGVHPARELDGVSASAGCGEIRELRVPLLDAARHLVLCRPVAVPGH
ncbi:MAG: 16S rRNA (guanine(527)-N(7))-methyltransferase RsmG [Proteobacteria bacterium]|nr:16S rRNA (guanine(527)-N(7))-methyltransferase RsmG [Pseudomonadota bacterium]